MDTKQQVREAEVRLRHCQAKAKTHSEEERCLKQYKIDVLKIKDSKAQPMFKDTDKILVHRDGVDYQADIGPLMGGGGSLDDILNAPIVKGPTYEVWEDVAGLRMKMSLLEGEGKSNSVFRANTYGYSEFLMRITAQASIDGYIQYKSLNRATRHAHNSYADFSDLKIKAYKTDKTTEATDIYCVARSGYFRAYIKDTTNYPTEREYALELTFTNVNGDSESLWIETKLMTYRAMRREDIDLTEMEELDKALKAKKAQATAKLKKGKN